MPAATRKLAIPDCSHHSPHPGGRLFLGLAHVLARQSRAVDKVPRFMDHRKGWPVFWSARCVWLGCLSPRVRGNQVAVLGRVRLKGSIPRVYGETQCPVERPA